MQAHSQELIEDYRKAIDQIIALRARVAELEAAVWGWALSSNKQDADQKLLDFITPKP